MENGGDGGYENQGFFQDLIGFVVWGIFILTFAALALALVC